MIKMVAIISGAVLLLGGGSAAAYYTLIMPNQPAAVLKKSLQNSLKQDKVVAKGTLESTTGQGGTLLTSSNSKTSFDYTLQVDGTTDNSALETTLKFNGKNFPIELRSVDKIGYVKLGDVSDLLGDVGAISPQFQQLVTAIDAAISNQWISFKDDRASKTLSCFGTFPDAKQSKEEFAFLEQTFKNNQFAKITATSKDKVDGKNTIKYTISFDKGKSKDFMERLKERPRYKEFLKCLGVNEESALITNKKQVSTLRSMVGLEAAVAKDQKSGSSSATSSDATDNVSLQLWVDSSKKLISKVQLDSSSSDYKVVLTANLEYGQTKIEKPDKSKTVEELLNEIGPTIQQIAPDLQGWLTGFTTSNSQSTSTSRSGNQTAARNTERQMDIKAIHGQLESFYSEKAYYPTLANLNDTKWRAANMKELDQGSFKDPSGTAAVLVAAPAKNTYSYRATNSKGGACTNQAGNECTKYTLTATFEGQVDGQSTYVKTEL